MKIRKETRGFMVQVDGTPLIASFPYIERWYFKIFYPFAIIRAIHVCRRYKKTLVGMSV